MKATEEYEGWSCFTAKDLAENLCYVEDLCDQERRLKCEKEKRCTSTENEEEAENDFKRCVRCRVVVEATGADVERVHDCSKCANQKAYTVCGQLHQASCYQQGRCPVGKFKAAGGKA